MLKIIAIPDKITVCFSRGRSVAIDKIIIRGARQHNLKNIDIELPHRKVIAVTGVSGSGKSSLAFDTIYAEGQRRYIESLSTYARQFIEKLDRPDLDSISGISPTIAIRQKNTVTSARSTVGTATEIYDYLRLLFARAGRIICPDCGIDVRSYSPSDAAASAIEIFDGRKIFILMPERPFDAENWEQRRTYLKARGYTRLLVDGEVRRIEEFEPEPPLPVNVDVLLDRIGSVEENRTRIAEVVELAYREHGGIAEVMDQSGDQRVKFSQAPSCSSCGMEFQPLRPILFSFNSPYGACPECKGFGDRMEFSENMIIPDPSKSLEERAVDPWSRERFEYFHYRMLDYCREKNMPTGTAWSSLPERDRSLILEGDGEYSGVIPFLEKMKEKSYKKGHRFFTRRYMDFTRCRACGGSRLRKEASYVFFGGQTIDQLTRMVPLEILKVLGEAEMDEKGRVISKDILYEIDSRLRFLLDVGLGYLTLDRLTKTLSGGEAQRINLANSLGANLVDTLYVLDEPSVGLHAADNERLINVMRRLRDLGNTVIVVEHDPEIIVASDHLVDLGPGPGREGGSVLFNGSMADARKADISGSATLQSLFIRSKKSSIFRQRREPTGKISLNGVKMHNIDNLDVEIPLGNLVCVTGISGSGKSSLVVDVLHKVFADGNKTASFPFVKSAVIDGSIDKVLLVDQSPIGASPRSNPITYIKGFSYIRELFASQKKSLVRGYKPGRFSFNKTGGRCSKCQGMGYRRVEMHFMADVFVPCEQCEGSRYNRETLEIEYRGKNISDVLEMTVDEAIMFFDEVPMLGEKLWVLAKTGLGYLKLGQPSNTLSGGEAQRIKIARELSESGSRNNVYIMDEPTTGLHMKDVDRLIQVLDELISTGHSVILIEHNMEVIGRADYIIDLGPGGGDEGGSIVACGHPSEIVRSKKSRTGEYLAKYVRKF